MVALAPLALHLMGQWHPHIRNILAVSLAVLLLTPLACGYQDTALQLGGKGLGPRTGRRIRSYHHLEGDVRWRRLYSTNHFFLRIGGDGKVEGTRQKETPNSIMEIRSVNVGTVVVRSVHSGFYLAMDKKGRIYGTKAYDQNCKFKERIEENGYNTYASVLWHHKGRPMFLSLNRKGLPRWGPKTRRQQPSTHFLPLLIS